MSGKSYPVVVIGGGATGTGIIRDLAMRGIEGLLVEQGDLAHGTSSRFHGLLHSGARYVVRDGQSARECLEENYILRRIAPNCVEPTGGLFVLLAGDDTGYPEQWLSACAKAGIPAEEEDVGELRGKCPALTPDIIRAYRVPDCSVDGFRVLWGNVKSARRYGAQIVNYTAVAAIHSSNGKVCGVELTNSFTGARSYVECGMVVNAAGAWAGRVAAMAGLEVRVIKDRGTLIAFNHRLAGQVINRLRPPSDGDIFVPGGAITIFGTTSRTVEDPSGTDPDQREVLELIGIGREMVPGLESFRLLRAFAGVRPLYQEGESGRGRSVSRGFALLDHRERDGLSGLVSVVGGKFTTFRLMAEKAADLVAGRLGVAAPCRTAEEPLAEPVSVEMLRRGRSVFGVPGVKMAAERLGDSFPAVLEKAAADAGKREIICECELVSRAEIEHAAGQEETRTLGDIRRKTRMGMGTCQGTFCSFRALGALEADGQSGGDCLGHMTGFLQGRWKGIRPVLWGQQLREAQLSLAVYGCLLGMERV